MKKSINKKIEKLRTELNLLIEQNVGYEKILKKSQKLDKYFLKWYKNIQNKNV